MIVTREYLFLNPELNELNYIIENTRQENDKKYSDDCCSEIEI